MTPLIISACLIGVNCRYAGDGQRVDTLDSLRAQYSLIPVCPEQLGGLTTPRKPAERQGSRVVTCDGKDVTDAFTRGAREALRIADVCGAGCALLKERSPSCGCGMIYDGTFSGAKCAGNGVTAELFLNNGIEVFGESRIEELLDRK